jgi:hypothetical protein
VARTYSYQELTSALQIYRFAQPDTITIQYALMRAGSTRPRGAPRLEQSLTGRSAQILGARTPWIRNSSAQTGATGLATTSQTRCPVPGPSGTYCGTSVTFNPYFAGSPFGEFQNPPGTGQSEPITITFSPAVSNIAVSIADPDFPGNTLTVHSASGSPVYTFVGDGTPGTYTEYQIITGDVGVTSIDLTPASGDYVAYFGLSFTIGDSIVVTCSPSSVQRAQQPITCSATSSNPANPVQVSSWRFVGAPQTRIQVDEATQSATWSSLLVTSGRVSVVGTIGGASGTAGTNVTATARDWSTMLPNVLTPLQLGPDNLPPHPTRVGELGNTDFLDNIATFEQDGTAQVPAGGPNGGVFYVTKVPFTAQPRIRVNTTALSTGSDFYNLQKRNGGGGMCGQSDVVPFVPVVRAHEGVNFEPKSHTNFYRAKANKISGLLSEAIVGLNLSDLQDEGDSVVSIIRTAAHDSSQWADSAAFRPVYCIFKYFKP